MLYDKIGQYDNDWAKTLNWILFFFRAKIKIIESNQKNRISSQLMLRIQSKKNLSIEL